MSYTPARGDIVTAPRSRFPHVHYVITGTEPAAGDGPHGPLYTASRTVAFTDGPRGLVASAFHFALVGSGDVTASAERVRAFLAARSTQGGGDPATIYQVGEPGTGELLDLNTADLVALVRGVLGQDAIVTLPRRQYRPVPLPADLLAREAAGYREAETDGD